MYLMIENGMECPVEGFTTLGLSTARDNADSIGQFGSGNKHAVLLCMRNGINPLIYSGTTKIEFYSEPSFMGDKSYNKVFIKIGNNKPKESSFCLEFGELDWNSLDMALREFVSNAIDNGGFSNTNLSIIDYPRAKSGVTRIYIPLTPDVQRFYNTISDRFLHFVGKDEDRVIKKSVMGPARIYRKGVFVREMKENSLFDYNFDNSTKIDECRNMDEWSAKTAAAKLLCKDKSAIKEVLLSFRSDKQYFEHAFSQYIMRYNGSKEVWQLAWQEVHGDAVLCSSPIFSEVLMRKGFTCQIIGNDDWRATLESMDIPNETTRLLSVEQKGMIVQSATNNAINTCNVVWKWLDDVNMTNGKPQPMVGCFSKLIDAGSELKGYYSNGTVYINVECDSDKQTMLEELAHYITGATDNSRDFQEFAFLFGKRMAEIIYD